MLNFNNFNNRISGRGPDRKKIYIVSGFKRSGTSLMMSMLIKMGINPYYSRGRERTMINRFPAENPFFYESGKYVHKGFGVKDIPKLKGKCVKIFSYATQNLPEEYLDMYKMIIMDRPKEDVIRSIRKYKDPEVLSKTNQSERHVFKTYTLEKDLELLETTDFEEMAIKFGGLIVKYEDLLNDPVSELERIGDYLGFDFNISKVAS
ncbi:MAG: hypothetical protein U9N53_13550, partial [Bacteroidota bacterium]|nr:hypothetical protein [Bacteroidota bacterium]